MDGDDNHEPLNIVNEILSAAITIGCKTRSIEICISGSTDVDLCGLQVWPCSVLLIDWLVHKFGVLRLNRSSILELGAGPGLIAVALSPYTSSYIASDSDPNVLDLCKHNVAQNRSPISVLKIDLHAEDLCLASFDVNLVIAADLIYDDDLTSALVLKIAQYLNSNRSGRVIIANESRLNFLIETLAIGDAAMDFFFKSLCQAKLQAIGIDCSTIPSCSNLIRSPTSMLFEIVLMNLPKSNAYLET